MANILVIDDDEQIRSYVKKLLEKYDHRVFTAENGKRGYELFLEQDIDLVITDIVMPEKEGIELIMDLKHARKNVKIIAISGGGMNIEADNNLAIAKTLGVSATLSKPFTNAEILSIVDRLLRNKA